MVGDFGTSGNPGRPSEFAPVKKNLWVGVFKMRKFLFLPYQYPFYKKCDSEAMKDSQTKIFGK